MAAEVSSSLFRFLSGQKEDQQKIKAEEPNIPLTRDLLGGSEELDLDFQVPKGWEKRLDLKVSNFDFSVFLVHQLFAYQILRFLEISVLKD